MKHVIFSVLACATIFLSGCGDVKPVTVVIQSVGNEMKYNVTRFEVKAGQEVTLIMENKSTIDVMRHNIVVLNDAAAINEVGQAAISAPGYIPANEAIIAATAIAGPGEKTQVTFSAPETPGDYPYICTFPGHYVMMTGVMVVK
jgi:uncharacterized protein